MLKIPTEYETGFDFGFSAIDSEEAAVETQAVTQQIVQPVNDEIVRLKQTVDAIYNKVDSLEEIIKAGVSPSFDVDAYRALVEKDVHEKLKKLEGLIVPLLVNLMKNPEKETIKWPNRKPIIEAQLEKILSITRA
jgi:tetrahydromethanopterin S-methyltransferase subunit B